MKLLIRSLILTFILCPLAFLSQDYKNIQKAIEAEKKYDYGCAIKYLNRALTEDPENEYIHYRLGKNYFNQNDYENAIYHYEQSKALMKDSMSYHFDMYHLYSVTGYNSFAKESFIKYITLCPSCVKSDLLPGNSSNKMMYKKPLKEPELMGYETNKTEYYPYIINDNQIQLLNVKVDKSKPTNALHFDEYLTYDFANHDFLFFDVNQYKQINKQYGYKYGPFSLNSALNKIYITRWDSENNRLNIFFSKRDTSAGDYAWERYRTLKIEIDKGNYNFIHPMLTKDEKHLIFSSNQPGGLGGYDLWIGEIADDLTLKNVKNLGTYVNTPGDECFPTVYDNNVIFFASNGHYGFGNLDMYAGVKSRGGRFMKTYNLGNRFNSTKDDYAIFYNQKKGTAFFTSNRYRNGYDSMAFDRIYKQSFDKIDATVRVTDENKKPLSGISVSLPSENVSKQTDINGHVSSKVNPLNFKKVVLTSDKYQTIDTNLAPFESEIHLIASRKAPKDPVEFLFLSHPFENPVARTYYRLTNLTENKIYTGYSDDAGMVQLTMFADDDYSIEVPDYSFSQANFKFDGAKKKFFVRSDMPAKKPEIENKANAIDNTPMKDEFNLYYESGQWLITEGVDRQIQHVVQLLNQNPSYRLELLSHTDCQGDEAFNTQLSKMRLEEAKKLFFSRGISESQMIGKYYGELRPANACKCDNNNNYNCPSDEMKKNRRTEVRVIRQ